MVELSVVVPTYRCEDCLRALHRRLTASVAPLVASYELVFVDDRSPDDSWGLLRELASSDPHVRLLRLSRNFGQHAAITAGLAHSTGRWIVVTDCDLEDPPEEIPRLYAKAQEGYDIVFARRRLRRQSLFRRVAARTYRRLANFLARTDIDPDYTNLSIASRKVIDAFLGLRDVDRHYLLILLWLGFEHTTIDVDQDERYAGQSSYTFGELIRVAADGMFFQTTNLLRWIIYGGFVIAVLGSLALGGLVAYGWFLRDPPPGWASLATLVMLLSGVIVISTGVTGLYVGKVFSQVKGRPLYVVDSELSGGAEQLPDATATGAESVDPVGAPAEGER
ncbi:MAG: glycosyltransferase family 2 protein [Actinomycetota bacterium]